MRSHALTLLWLSLVGGCAEAPSTPDGDGGTDTDVGGSDTEEPVVEGPEVPEVESRTVESSLSVGVGSGVAQIEVDVDEDGTADFVLELRRDQTPEDQLFEVALRGLVATSQTLSGPGGPTHRPLEFDLGEPINSLSTVWNQNSDPAELETFMGEIEEDVRPVGRVFTGHRFQHAGYIHYAWMELSVSEGLTEVTLHRLGWHTGAEVEIRAGDL